MPLCCSRFLGSPPVQAQQGLARALAVMAPPPEGHAEKVLTAAASRKTGQKSSIASRRSSSAASVLLMQFWAVLKDASAQQNLGKDGSET